MAEKRFEVLIEAFYHVHKRYSDYTLIIYGRGPFLDKYKRIVSDYGLDGFVQFPGFVSNVAETIREDGIFVLSSKFEGIPNALIEALSTGIPCVATDCSPGGPAFLTKNGQNGVLVKVDDADALASSIIKLIENPNYAVMLSERGPEILNDLAPDHINSLWIKAFQIICNSK